MYDIGSSASKAVDSVMLFIVIVSVVLLVLVTGLMIYFAIRYNRKRHPEPVEVKENKWLEITWTVIPGILVLAMFFYGYEGFRLIRDVPDDAMVVHVTGRMWDWSFEYENGIQAKKLYVPVGKPIKLILKSVDVIHSFYIPTFRIKEDVVPGQETYLWFKPQTTGPADIFCAEFCGERHAFMLSQVIVMTAPAFKEWYAKGEAKTLEVHPVEKLMDLKGCLTCHSLDDSAGSRLSLKGIFGKTRTVVLQDQSVKEVVADEDYLKRAILSPTEEIVKGQIDSMPVTEDLTPEELSQIVEYLKTL